MTDSTREQNLAVLRGYFEAMSAGGPPAAMPFYHPEVVLEVPGGHAASGTWEGHEGVGRFGATMAGLTDRTFRLSPVDLLASDDHVVTIADASATVGDAELAWRRVIVSEVRDGMLARLRFFESDQAGVDALLGGRA
ncbi:nuclear transport factor 2 family protein [Agromyces sp. SYSU T00194]|uniref:nuclear transport factor 2 family protein n=1 Tax=Agromyces chitinivorans TaxID=3158560 RepID=UPI003394B1A2